MDRTRLAPVAAAAALALGCSPAYPIPLNDYRRAYADADLGAAVRDRVARGECNIDQTCGELSHVNCRAEVDGPAYFVHTASWLVLEICGGACMQGPQATFCVSCPPPEWTCSL